jgi:hypothetical protein
LRERASEILTSLAETSAIRFKPAAIPVILFLLTLGFTLVIGVQYHISYHHITLPVGKGFF